MKFFIFLTIFFILNTSYKTLAADIEQVWTITSKTVSPDGVPKTVPVVNGQFPGPELRGRVGQSVRIELRNRLRTESTTIHWHGIKQTGTVWSDGVPGITQCPIEPGENYVYEFVLDAPGTLWWHSHSDFQKSSMYGAIVIEGDERLLDRKYDEERTLLLNDWFHEDAALVAQNLLTPLPAFQQPTFNSLLINGKGVFDCASDPSKICDPSHPDAGPYVLNVEPGKNYRLRFVGAATDSFLNFGIEHHRMRVIEAETTLLRSFWANHLDVNAGQTYSVLLRTLTTSQLRRIPENNGMFWIQVNTHPFNENLRAFAILKYSTASEADETPLRAQPNWEIQNEAGWSLRQARRQRAVSRVRDMPAKADRVFTIVPTLNFNSGRVNFAFNNITFVEGGTPILHAATLKIASETDKYVEQTTIPTVFDYTLPFDENNLLSTSNIGTHVMKVKKDEVIDIVFQNAVFAGGQKESHPMHLHLHNFWVLGYGNQDGSPWTPADERRYDMTRPVSRNTLTLFEESWSAIRVKFDNLGVAFMHCHINPHLFLGMALSIQIGDSDELPALPAGIKLCGTALNRN